MTNGRWELGAYGLGALPLAMAALPLYVYLPKYYGDHLGVPLTVLGLLLLSLRLVDGVSDPLLGYWSDRLASRKQLLMLAVPFLGAGMLALFSPPTRDPTLLLVWLGVALAVVYAAFSLATINLNAWGAEMSRDPVERTRITAVREGLALAGVVLASIAPAMLGGAGGETAGLPRFAMLFAVLLVACTAITVAFAPAPEPARSRLAGAPEPKFAGIAGPLQDPLFRRLLAAFVANGIASAIPATLVLFFIADVLAAESRQGLFLALYFVAGAAGMPLWVKLSAAIGKIRAWGFAMVLAIAAFGWVALLGAGDTTAFAIICVLSGLALGADLALPPSLLADVIDRGGSMRATGTYFGLWTLATKLNLALAAGIALPLLGVLGYVPGSRDPEALRALTLVYAVVPCVLKLIAIGVLCVFARAWKER